MPQNPLYSIYTLVVFGAVAVAEWRGFSMNRINELKDVPKTVRDNPGAYRSHYGYYPGRYIGGK
jgi:hypothetical protein